MIAASLSQIVMALRGRLKCRLARKTGVLARHADGKNIAEAMMRIFQDTGKPVDDPGTQRSYRRLDLMAALEHVMKK